MGMGISRTLGGDTHPLWRRDPGRSTSCASRRVHDIRDLDIADSSRCLLGVG